MDLSYAYVKYTCAFYAALLLGSIWPIWAYVYWHVFFPLTPPHVETDPPPAASCNCLIPQIAFLSLRLRIISQLALQMWCVSAATTPQWRPLSMNSTSPSSSLALSDTERGVSCAAGSWPPPTAGGSVPAVSNGARQKIYCC
jgi:hypothetical protein